MSERFVAGTRQPRDTATRDSHEMQGRSEVRRVGRVRFPVFELVQDGVVLASPWNRNGDTATHNGQMLCGPANRAKSDHIEHHPDTHRSAGADPGDDTLDPPTSRAA